MTKNKLKLAQYDYDNLGLSTEELCIKYSCKMEDLKALKGLESLKKPLVLEDIETSIVPEVLTETETLIVPKVETEVEVDAIADYKVKALELATKYITSSDVQYEEPKNIKIMTDIVLNIEASNSKHNKAGPTINILVQNLTETFKDDC